MKFGMHYFFGYWNEMCGVGGSRRIYNQEDKEYPNIINIQMKKIKEEQFKQRKIPISNV